MSHVRDSGVYYGLGGKGHSGIYFGLGSRGHWEVQSWDYVMSHLILTFVRELQYGNFWNSFEA